MAVSQNVPEGYRLERKRSFTHMAIGVFGALAIIGVLAKIFAFQFELLGMSIGWQPFVLIGFIGEACVFIIMGMLKEFTYVPTQEDRREGAEASQVRFAEGNGTVERDFRADSDEKPEAETMDEAADQIAEEARMLGREMEETRQTLSRMNQELRQAVSRLEQFNQPDSTLPITHSENQNS